MKKTIIAIVASASLAGCSGHNMADPENGLDALLALGVGALLLCQVEVC